MPMTTESGTNNRMARRLVFLSILALLAAAAQPWLWSWVRELAADFHNRRSQAEQLSQLTERGNSVREALAKQQGFIDDLTAVAPRDHGAVVVIEALEQQAAAQGLTLTIEDISEPPDRDGPDATTPAAVLEPLTVTLLTTGEPAALLALVDGIERLPLMTRLTVLSLALAPGGGPAVLGGYILEVSVEFFMQRDYGASS